MSLFEALSQTQTSYPDAFTDSMSNMVTSILQEQLAPILGTLREHARLLDLHAALLNHSTAINRYNVGKLDDIRDFQTNLNFKLQFYIDPEDRWYPDYRNPQVPAPLPRTEAVSDIQTLPLPRTLDLSDEPTQLTQPSTTASSSTPGRPPPSSLPPNGPPRTRPPTPTQESGDEPAVVVRTARRLQRERPFGEPPDPMWNSFREINPEVRLASPAPPPPYVLPPAYAPESPAPHVSSQAATSTLTARRTTPPPSAPLPPPPTGEEEVPSPSLRALGKRRSTSDDDDTLGSTSSSSSSSSSSSVARRSSAGGSLRVSEDDGDGNDEPDAGPNSQLSEKARGKKRMREEVESSDEDEEEGPFAPSNGGGGGGASSSRLRPDQPDRKRKKMDTMINTDRLDVDESVAMVARAGLVVKPMTLKERVRQADKLRSMEKLFRGGRGLALAH